MGCILKAMATALIRCLALRKRKRELMGATPARQRDSYVLIIGLYKCVLHKRNIAGSVPCVGFHGFRGFLGVFDVRSETVCCAAVAGQTLTVTGHELMHKSNLKSL